MEKMVTQLFLEKTRLSLVKSEEIKNIFKKYEIETEFDRRSGKEFIYLSEEDRIKGIPGKCSGCGGNISLDNFGHLVKGSKLLYCKNPLCFNHFLATKKIRGENGEFIK